MTRDQSVFLKNNCIYNGYTVGTYIFENSRTRIQIRKSVPTAGRAVVFIKIILEIILFYDVMYNGAAVIFDCFWYVGICLMDRDRSG